MEEGKAFLMNESVNVIYPNEENAFMVHNHEKKRLLRASMFIIIDERTLIPKKWWKGKLFL